MSQFYQKDMVAIAKKLDGFGEFALTYMEIKSTGKWACATSRKQFIIDNQVVFTNKFLHFISMIPQQQLKFYNATASIFMTQDNKCYPFYVALIKKCMRQLQIYLFESKSRSEVVRLMLHRDVIKRFSLYIDENIQLATSDFVNKSFKNMFAQVSDIENIKPQSYLLLEEIFSVLLTQKEQRLVLLYLELHIVKSVAEDAGLSRSYVNQLLLSAAHKLGLSRVSDLLMMYQPNSILFKRGAKHEQRCHRL